MFKFHPRSLLRLAAFGLLVAGGTSAAHAEAVEEKLAALPAGISLVGSRGIEDFKLSGSDGKLEFVEVSGQAFQRAARVSTLARPETRWALQLTARTAAAVKK